MKICPKNPARINAAEMFTFRNRSSPPGPLPGGILVDQAAWRWIFFINIPIGAVGMVLATVSLREALHDDPGRLDLLGLVLSGDSIDVLLYTMSIGPERGRTSSLVVSLAWRATR